MKTLDNLEFGDVLYCGITQVKFISYVQGNRGIQFFVPKDALTSWRYKEELSLEVNAKKLQAELDMWKNEMNHRMRKVVEAQDKMREYRDLATQHNILLKE